MRAYHRVDPLMDERKGHYSPAQLGAFLKIQLVAGRQTKRGRFRSFAVLRGVLPASYVKHLAFLVSEGDIVELPDGSIYLDGWDEWQEGDLTVRDRMAALRNRRRNGGVTETVTATVTEPLQTATGVGVGVGVGVEEAADAASTASATDPVVIYATLAGGFPSQKAMDWLDDLSGMYGADAVIRALGKARGSAGKIIGAAQDILRAGARELSLKEKDAERERVEARRVDGMMARRLEWFHNTGQWDPGWGERPAA